MPSNGSLNPPKADAMFGLEHITPPSACFYTEKAVLNSIKIYLQAKWN